MENMFGDLPPGNYIIMAAFPDGSNTSLGNVRMQDGSVQTLYIKYLMNTQLYSRPIK